MKRLLLVTTRIVEVQEADEVPSKTGTEKVREMNELLAEGKRAYSIELPNTLDKAKWEGSIDQAVGTISRVIREQIKREETPVDIVLIPLEIQQ